MQYAVSGRGRPGEHRPRSSGLRSGEEASPVNPRRSRRARAMQKRGSLGPAWGRLGLLGGQTMQAASTVSDGKTSKEQLVRCFDHSTKFLGADGLAPLVGQLARQRLCRFGASTCLRESTPRRESRRSCIGPLDCLPQWQRDGSVSELNERRRTTVRAVRGPCHPLRRLEHKLAERDSAAAHTTRHSARVLGGGPGRDRAQPRARAPQAPRMVEISVRSADHGVDCVRRG